MQVCREKGHTWKKGRIVVNSEFVGTAMRWACQKVNEPGDKISVFGAWVQKPLQGSMHHTVRDSIAPGSCKPWNLPFTESFLCSRLWS